MRGRLVLAVWAALCLLAAACGQKSGVAGSVSAISDGTFTGDAGSTDDSSAVTDPAAGAVADPGAAGTTTTGTGQAAAGRSTTTGRTGATTARATAAPVAAAGGKEDRTGITANEIVIGIHAPITGAAPIETFAAGTKVYFGYSKHEVLTAVGNRKVRVEYEDDKFDPVPAKEACKKLAEQKRAFLLVGGAGADQIEACAKYAAEQGIPYISAGVHEGALLGLSTYFAVSESYEQQAPQLAQVIKNNLPAKKKIAIVTTDSDLLKGAIAAIKKATAANGVEFTIERKLPKALDYGAASAVATELQANCPAAECVVYVLLSPTVFGALVGGGRDNGYNPAWVAPGLSISVNTTAGTVCGVPVPEIYAFSPMVQMDVIDTHDADYKPAYTEENGSTSRPDDIGLLIWGLSKTLRLMFDATGPQISRQSFMRTLESGKQFASNVYGPVQYGPGKRLGASTVNLVKLSCSPPAWNTVSAHKSSF